LTLYNLFIKEGKPTPLFKTFSKGALFFWGLELDGFQYKRWRVPGKPDPRDNDERFRPLLAPPAPGQGKFEQILQWAKEQEKGKRN